MVVYSQSLELHLQVQSFILNNISKIDSQIRMVLEFVMGLTETIRVNAVVSKLQ